MKDFSEELKDFIKNLKWIFAKSYASTWPHHYIVRERVDEDLFIQMVKHIRRFCYEGRFYKKKYTYFEKEQPSDWMNEKD